MRDVTLVILNSLRIKCHIRRPLITDLGLGGDQFHGMAYWVKTGTSVTY